MSWQVQGRSYTSSQKWWGTLTLPHFPPTWGFPGSKKAVGEGTCFDRRDWGMGVTSQRTNKVSGLVNLLVINLEALRSIKWVWQQHLLMTSAGLYKACPQHPAGTSSVCISNSPPGLPPSSLGPRSSLCLGGWVRPSEPI